MPAKALLIRYPDGDFEYEFTRLALPVIGDTIKRKGELWRVTRVTRDSVPTAFVQRAEGTQHPPPSGRMQARGISTPVLTFRFPDGDVEHRSAPGGGTVGTLIRSRGVMWRVMRVEGSTVHLKLDEREPRPDGGPIVTPTPLADGHPDFEVMSEV